MATSTDARILAALSAHLEALQFTPSLKIAHPGVDFPAAGTKRPDKHLSVTFLPNQTRQITLGGDPQMKRGLYQVSVMWKRSVGLIKPLDVAGAIIDHFKDQVLHVDGVRVTIYQEPWAAPPLQDDDRVQVPVTIPYLAFEAET